MFDTSRKIRAIVNEEPGLTISTPLIGGTETSVTAFSLGSGTDISPETYDTPILYIGLSGSGDFLLGGEHIEKQTGNGELLAVKPGTLCGVKTYDGFVYTEIISKEELNMIDEELGSIAADFWNLTWKSEKRTLSYEMRLLLSLANAVGAGRMRQATRELVKAYVHGLDSAALDDVFELLAWNQGIGYFSSEIGPSPLFQAYKLIKNQEKQGRTREKICAALKEQFGEKNPEVQV